MCHTYLYVLGGLIQNIFTDFICVFSNTKFRISADYFDLRTTGGFVKKSISSRHYTFRSAESLYIVPNKESRLYTIIQIGRDAWARRLRIRMWLRVCSNNKILCYVTGSAGGLFVCCLYSVNKNLAESDGKKLCARSSYIRHHSSSC